MRAEASAFKTHHAPRVAQCACYWKRALHPGRRPHQFRIQLVNQHAAELLVRPAGAGVVAPGRGEDPEPGFGAGGSVRRY